MKEKNQESKQTINDFEGPPKGPSPVKQNVVLSVKNLTVAYGRYEVLKDISFDIEKGDYVGIAGPNGSGKSTLVKTLLGLLEKRSGTITFENTSKKSKQKIGYLPQVAITTDSLFPAKVKEIVEMGLLVQKKFPKILNRSDREQVKKTLKELEIEHLSENKIGKLSGGQQQRVLLARALVCEPEILILDEPTSALDPKMRGAFYGMIKKLNKQKKVTIMLVSHDMGSIGQFTNKMMYLDRRLVFFGSYNDFCVSQTMTQYFGFESQHSMCWQHGEDNCPKHGGTYHESDEKNEEIQL